MAKPRVTGPAKGIAVPPRPRKPIVYIKSSRRSSTKGESALASAGKRPHQHEGDVHDSTENPKKRRKEQAPADSGKRKASEPTGEDARERGKGYQTLTKRVRLAKVKRQWKPLSATSQEAFRALLGDATSAALSSVPRGRALSNLQSSLELLNSRLAKILPKIRAPPSAASGFGVTKGNELEIPNADGLAAKIAELEGLAEGERRIVNKLKAFVDDESRLLRGEKRELADFEKKRKAVERDEIKELTSKIHPALKKLYTADISRHSVASTSSPHTTSGHHRTSHRWASEAASIRKAVDAALQPPPGADDEEGEAEEAAYDPLGDPFLKYLASQAMPTLVDAEDQIAAIAHAIQALVRAYQTDQC